ncbi:hypothetical protein C1Y40_01031 [Mycobacterium talmoniae]|uniref:Uncharacterized protein n=1 Tax=Mycobacterium talmoniae TaxID=1858794 RepID=A0A2S8BPZ7_9MYCO|nr:hypothetical protein C1Y40_01031 [Mycobacterium talmoniae]
MMSTSATNPYTAATLTTSWRVVLIRDSSGTVASTST